MSRLEPQGRRQVETALVQFDKLRQQRPAPAAPHLGLAYGRLGQLLDAYGFGDAARAAYRNALRLRPGDYRWPYLLGRQHAHAGQHAAAIHGFERALALIAASPRPPAKQQVVACLVHLGRLQLENQQLAQARALFEQALRIRSDAAAAWDGLSRCEQAEGRPGAAIAALERARTAAPGATSLDYRLALLYREQGDHQQASAALVRSGRHGKPVPLVVRDPLVGQLYNMLMTPVALHRRGKRLSEQGQPERALELYQRALEMAPDHAPTHQNLGVLLLRLGRDAQGIVALERAIELDPDAALARANLGMARLRAGDAVGAIEQLRRAEALTPEDQFTRLTLARALLATNDPEAALSRLQQLLTVEPGNRRALLARATALDRLQRPDEALAALEDAHRRLPRDAAIGRALGRRLLTLPETDEAGRARARTLLQAAQVNAPMGDQTGPLTD